MIGTRDQRTRLAAGLIGCSEEQVQARVRAMPGHDRVHLTSLVDWLVAYEYGFQPEDE